MKKYVSKLLEETTRDLDSTANMPAANHLLNVMQTATKLPHDKSELFHHLVAKLL